MAHGPWLIRIPLNSCTVGKAPPVHPYRGIRIFSYSHPLGLNLKRPDSIGIRIRASRHSCFPSRLRRTRSSGFCKVQVSSDRHPQPIQPLRSSRRCLRVSIRASSSAFQPALRCVQSGDGCLLLRHVLSHSQVPEDLSGPGLRSTASVGPSPGLPSPALPHSTLKAL